MAELAPADETGMYRLSFAGDTFNTAWYLARISQNTDVSYFTAVGDDEISFEMLSFFRASGIGDQYVQTIPNKTVGLYQIRLRNGERSFTYWRGQSAARQLADDKGILLEAVMSADLIYLSGITLAILTSAARDQLISVLRSARKAGKIIAFDPNLRPSLWASEREMISSIVMVAAISDIVLPSFADEAAWFKDGTLGETLQRYASLGVDHVILKDGEKPVRFRSKGESMVVPFPSISTPVDTTAAGDSFNAGFLAGILSGENMQSSIEMGCAIAGKVVQLSGALVRTR